MSLPLLSGMKLEWVWQLLNPNTTIVKEGLALELKLVHKGPRTMAWDYECMGLYPVRKDISVSMRMDGLMIVDKHEMLVWAIAPQNVMNCLEIWNYYSENHLWLNVHAIITQVQIDTDFDLINRLVYSVWIEVNRDNQMVRSACLRVSYHGSYLPQKELEWRYRKLGFNLFTLDRTSL